MADLWAHLESRWPESILEPNLSRMASVMELMGDPQRAYPVIHVAGTNGKSSTSRMIESLLRANGLRTGLFTSPHLVDVTERISLDGQPMSQERILAAWEEARPYIEVVDAQSLADGGPRMSFFEVMTVLAFAIFADAPVDVAVIEVGMGGGWDATNVVDSQVAVITPIGLDHMLYLGETLAAIAAEKAGIINEGARVVIAEQKPEVASVLLAKCAALDIAPVREGVEYGVDAQALAVGGQLVNLRGIESGYPEIFLPLFGKHQAHNAATALAAAESLVGALDIDVVREGFASVAVPGRLEIVRHGPTVLVDSAHNPHGAAALVHAIEESFTFDSLVGVIGMLEGKDALGFLELVMPHLSAVVITAPQSPRAIDARVLAEMAESVSGVIPVIIEDQVTEALTTSIALAEERAGGVLVCGSVVLAGDVVRLLGKK